MKVKSIGILGLGDQTTRFYIKELNDYYNDKNGVHSTYPFKLLNTNFDIINDLLPNPSKQLERIVKEYLEKIIELDIEAILIPNITLHETIDKLNIETTIIHPIHCTVSEIKQNNYKQVVLFGSTYTMESNYIKSNFAENDIKILLPSKKDMQFTDEVRKQVYQKMETKELLDNFNLIIKKYAQNNAVVIACTELSIALENENLKIFDIARIQIKQIV